MRFLRRLTLNRRAVFDNTLYVDTTNAVVMGSRNNLKLPSGTDAERPAIPDNGMIRFNETSGDIEVYQGSTWRALRYKESGEIVQQSLGVGDEVQDYFGPLNPSPYDIASQSGYTWTGANLLVLVENVLQLHNTNYTVVQNPTFAAETYDGTVSRTEIVGATRLYFNTSLMTTGASGSGTTVTITFAAQPAAPFSVGELVTIAGVVPYAYNGQYAITASTTTSISYISTATGAQTVAGTVTSVNTIYPTVDITGATVTGTNIPGATTVTAYTTDDDTGALTSIDISNPIAGSPITAGTAVTIAEASGPAPLGWYLHFSSPVPAGKPVTVLHGFDK